MIRRETGMIAWMADNPVAANLLMALVIFAGLLGFISITKELFPTFPSDTFTITVPYPGSSPEEVEEGIVVKIEEEIQDIVGIDEIRSTAREGAGVVTVKIAPGVDLPFVMNQAKIRVDGIAAFPLDAEEPIVEELLAYTRAINVTVYGNLTERQLKELGDELRDEMLILPGITQVESFGTRAYEISIEVSDLALQQYGLSFDRVVAAVRNNSRDLPGGKVRTEDGSITLRSVAQAYNAADYAALPLINRADGTRITLGDVAVISDAFEDQPILSRMNGQRSVTLQANRVGEQNLLQITDEVNRFVERTRSTLPDGVEITSWADSSKNLRGRMDLLFRSALTGSLLVVLTLALFLDLRLALWVIVGVPFSIMGAMGVIVLFGIPVSINVLSLFAFILVLGILVDDGIVTAESAYAQLEHEKQGIDSIVRGVKRISTATIFGALTTMIAFAPAMTLQDGFARSMTHIAPVVILCLAFSLIETKLILPAHLRHVRPRDAMLNATGLFARFTRFQNRLADGLVRFANTHYRRTLEAAVRARYVTLALFTAMLVITAALLPAGMVRFVFFPNVPSDYINIELKMPQGTSWHQTHAYSLDIEAAAQALNQRYQQETGEQRPVVEQLMVNSNSDTQSRITLQLIDSTERDVTSGELAVWLREEIGVLSGVQSLIFDVSTGPGGSPVDIELTAHNLDVLRNAARELRTELMRFEGVYDVRDTFDAGGPEIDIRLKPEGAALGLGQVELARQVRQAFFGAEIQRVQRGRHEVRVYVRFPADSRESLSTLDSMWISLPDGRKVPFTVVGEAQELTGVSAINRFNRERVVNVRAEVDKSRVEPGEIFRLARTEILPPLFAKYPGLSSRFAGEAEAQQESADTLLLGVLAVVTMIYAALAIPLKSYGQPLMIMSVIPFGVVGAIVGHWVLNKEISVLSIVGMMGLIGVVVNDSLVLVDHINHRIAEGHAWAESVMESGVRRFRAVVLTSATTFLGLLPIQLETSIQSEFIKPMAISVAFGVLFSTLVTLLLVPTLYFIVRDIRNGVRWLWAGTPVTAE